MNQRHRRAFFFELVEAGLELVGAARPQGETVTAAAGAGRGVRLVRGALFWSA